jgi:hypothetical protein
VQFHPGGMFVANRLFRQAIIANFDVSINLSVLNSVTYNIDELFYMVTFTLPADLSSYTFSSAILATRAFSGINNLGSLSSFNTANLQVANWCFAFSTFPVNGPDTANWQFPQLVAASAMFQGVGGAAFSLDSTNWGMQSINDMSYMFDTTSTITILDTTQWNTPSLYFTARFISDSSIISINITGWTTSNMISMEEMFRFTSTYVIGIDTIDTSILYICNHMFEEYTGSVIDVTGYNMAMLFSSTYMFSSYIESTVDVTTWNTPSLGAISFMFFKSNANPDVTGWNFDNVIDATEVLSGCYISKTNYDTFLVKLDSTLTPVTSGTIIQPRTCLHVGTPGSPSCPPQEYSLFPNPAQAAHDSLTGPKSWFIVDGGGTP